jgi:very-short-patch-repair endonuclease
LLARGITRHGIAANLAAGRWQRPLPGILVVFTGPLPAVTWRWAALLYAAPAVLSHETAGALWSLVDEPPDAPVHLTIEGRRGVRPRRGIVLHRSAALPSAVGSPPRTTVADTVIALCATARRAADAIAVLSRTAQHQPAALPSVQAQIADRPTLRRRPLLMAVAQDVASGAHSALEHRYLTTVERAHRLPAGARQRAVAGTAQDVHYKGYALTVELDGQLSHAGPLATARDMMRDNASVLRGETTLRFGWDAVASRPCDVAGQVGAVLRRAGWKGSPRRCGATCQLCVDALDPRWFDATQ